jgi:hypothetical protein
MPILNLPGLPSISMTDAQVQQFMAQNPALAPVLRQQLGLPAPAARPDPNAGHTLGARTTRDPNRVANDPCTAYENAKRNNQSAAIQDALRKKCQAYQDAQAFAAQAPPLTSEQLATMATQQMAENDAQSSGLSKNAKIGIAIGGGLVLLGGIYYLATR